MPKRFSVLLAFCCSVFSQGIADTRFEGMEGLSIEEDCVQSLDHLQPNQSLVRYRSFVNVSPTDVVVRVAYNGSKCHKVLYIERYAASLERLYFLDILMAKEAIDGEMKVEVYSDFYLHFRHPVDPVSVRKIARAWFEDCWGSDKSNLDTRAACKVRVQDDADTKIVSLRAILINDDLPIITFIEGSAYIDGVRLDD